MEILLLEPNQASSLLRPAPRTRIVRPTIDEEDWPTDIMGPDFYTWARDSALTVKALVHELILNDRTDLIRTIDDYVRSAAVLQTVYNPSGGLDDGRGLGEPKFNVDETRFNDPWGRPQRDGPALQAITLMDYVKWLVENGQRSKAQEIVWVCRGSRIRS